MRWPLQRLCESVCAAYGCEAVRLAVAQGGFEDGLLDLESGQLPTIQEPCSSPEARIVAPVHERGYRIVSGGTDNHLVLVDLCGKMTGAVSAL